jgi:hypothetical protein
MEKDSKAKKVAITSVRAEIQETASEWEGNNRKINPDK